MAGGWVIELDIESFFDTLDRGKLWAILHQRIRDGVIRRLIDVHSVQLASLGQKAGVLAHGRLTRAQYGAPRGSVISPLLANIYLHEVLDQWFEDSVTPRLRGRGFLMCYADDAVLCFSNQSDAAQVMDVLPKRFARYGLHLHRSR